MPGFITGRHRHQRVGPAPLAALVLMLLALLATTRTLALAEPPAPGQAAAAAASDPATQGQQGFGTDPKHDRPFDQEAQPLPLASPTEGDPAAGTPSYPSLELNGLIEGGWVRLDPFAGPPRSEWILYTLETMLTLKAHPWVTAQVSADYEANGRAPPYLDVAHALLGPPQGAWFIDAGQLYLPFGRYETHMASDPLTLALGETRDITAALGFEGAGPFGAIYAFSHQDLTGDTEKIDAWGAELGYTSRPGGQPLRLTLGYLSDLGNSDTLRYLVAGGGKVAGLALSALFEAGPWTFIGELVSATRPFGLGAGLALAGQRPSAWMIEVDCGFGFLGKEAQLALGYQGSAQALALKLPEIRALVTFNLGIYQYTTLQLEWAQDQDYHEAAGGTGKAGNSFTAQVAVEF
ncbi:MAG: LbtU family siderophore porin [Chromatiaceae bacterium]|nr:LbtU family siderophore porin [Chromatiaceae bacterium]